MQTTSKLYYAIQVITAYLVTNPVTPRAAKALNFLVDRYVKGI